MQVKLPPAKHMSEVHNYEQMLSMLIFGFSPHMYSLQLDIWTSRHEVGQVCETTGYVRWPYYLCENVDSMCAQQN